MKIRIKISLFFAVSFLLAAVSSFAGENSYRARLDDVSEAVLRKLDNLPTSLIPELEADLASSNGNALKTLFKNKPNTIDAWESFNDAGFATLRTDINQLTKFDDIIKNNNLNLDADGLGNILKARTTTNNLPWEHPENILDAVKRASDANINGITIKIKKFPAPADGSTSYVLSNAKQYQFEASGDAFLSFEKGGVSFDNIDTNGNLIDRKWGHSSIFDENGNILNRNRANSLLKQAVYGRFF